MIKTDLFVDGCNIEMKQLDVSSDIVLGDGFWGFRSRRVIGGWCDIKICLRPLVSDGCVGRVICIHRDSLSISRTLERLDKDEIGDFFLLKSK